ncbi:sugar ABC transporter ATP-binding protein [Lachnospiraceae bacterium ASD5720]|uniref:Sugar ABC transporter ATP-binding protein n=2 Tax=Diplocloster agilis TaxID=2850323 RepID=A0A949JWI6_9FIRM|nr:sugar ABC transporter ATP-binding protein [Diplocloster agilis]
MVRSKEDKAGERVVEKVLEMKGIYKAFPGVVAVDKVDLDLYGGEVLALMGENGAGKSTLIKILSGMYKADEGEIIVGGKSYKEFTTKEAIDLGIGIIYQELNYLNDLTIAENILLGQVPTSGPLKKIDYKNMFETAKGIMERVGLGYRKPTDMVSELSVAEKQLIEIARAFSRNVKILVMDEPTSALNEVETKKLFELIRDIKKDGVGVIYISHRMEELFQIADRVEIMRDGKYITTLNVKETNTDEIVAYMVGREVNDMYPSRDCKIGEVAFEVKGLSTSYLKDINLQVRAGEVVGLFGLMGAGRSEVCRCVVGSQKADKGTLVMNGQEFMNATPLEALKRGISYVPAERKTEGVNLVAPVRDNITLSNLDKIKRKGKLDLKYETQLAEEWVKKLSVKTPSVMTEAGTLSGGNQQKLVIAKSLNTDPSVMILNEPTRGIDVGAKVEIYNLINELCSQNKAVIMISSELPEIMALSDRIYVLCEGKITGEVSKGDYSQEGLLKYAIGEC